MTEHDSRLPARALGSLYIAGATIGLVSLLLPHSAHADMAGLYSNVALAYLGGLALLVGATRLPRWSLHVALVAGTLMITRAVVLSHDPVSFYSVWYLWVGLWAFYFVSRAAAAAQVGFVALMYGLTLVNQPPNSPLARWLTMLATLMVGGLLIDTLVRRARREALVAADSAKSMARVTEVSHQLASVSDSAAARPALCEAAGRVTQADSAVLWERSADGASLLVTGSSGSEPSLRELMFGGSRSEAIEAFTTAKAVSSVGGGGDRGADVDRGRGACVWQPILRDALPIAVLELRWEESSGLSDHSVRALIELLAIEASVTLERVALLAKLELIARTDELTGLPNRRAWQEHLQRELARAARAGEKLCVAMLDLDHFKRFNDDHGHQTGDRLLKQVASAWSSELRPSDNLARYGGEEFTLTLPACPPSEALRVVERLRAVMPDRQTCSAGIASWDGAESVAELLGRADEALYEAKRGGRNQSVIAEGDVVTPGLG